MLSGERIKRKRIEKNYSQLDLASLIGVSNVSVSFYEKNNRLPNVDKLLKLCEVLEVTPNYILGFDKLIVSEADENYNISLSDDEIEFIREIRKKKKSYKVMVKEPKRFAELIERTIIDQNK